MTRCPEIPRSATISTVSLIKPSISVSIRLPLGLRVQRFLPRAALTASVLSIDSTGKGLRRSFSFQKTDLAEFMPILKPGGASRVDHDSFLARRFARRKTHGCGTGDYSCAFAKIIEIIVIGCIHVAVAKFYRLVVVRVGNTGNFQHWRSLLKMQDACSFAIRGYCA